MSKSIRLLNENDFFLYKSIRLELLKNHPTYFGSSYEDESEFDDFVWKSRLKKNTVDTYGMFEDDDLIGLVVLVYNPRLKMKHVATLNSMYIKPAYRKQGLASRFIDKIIKDAIHQGLYRLNLSVVDTNLYAINLYQSKGFKPYGIEPDTICHEGIYYHLVLMSKLLYR